MQNEKKCENTHTLMQKRKKSEQSSENTQILNRIEQICIDEKKNVWAKIRFQAHV